MSAHPDLRPATDRMAALVGAVPLLDRILRVAGRDPGWEPPR